MLQQASVGFHKLMFKKLCQYCNEEETQGGAYWTEKKESKENVMQDIKQSLLFIVLQFSLFWTDFGGKSVLFLQVPMRKMELR